MNAKKSPLGTVALILSSAVLAQKPTAVEASIQKDLSMPVNGSRAVLRLSQTPPDGIAVPGDCVDAWFGTAEIGSQKTKVAVALGKSKADAAAIDTLYIDSNGDGKLEPGEKSTVSLVSEKTKRGDREIEIEHLKEPSKVNLNLGGASMQGLFSFQRAVGQPPQAALQYASYIAAKVKLGSEDRYVVVVDQDQDGKFNGAKDVWLLYKNGDKAVSDYLLCGWDDSAFANGKRVSIKVAANNKLDVTMKDAAGPDPAVAANQRERVEKTWVERFAPTRDEFNKQKEIDTSRPLAKTPIQWNYVSFAEAKKLAAAAKKPLFIDVMAFWCVWCYRMDYHTYPDQEVAQVLNDKFVPVKIIQEQAAEGDYDLLMKEKLKARGIPAMGVFDAEGNVLHTIGGWMKPEKFLEELNKGLEAAAKK